MAECSPACFASQPRGAPIASAHLTDVPVEEKRARIKHNCTCGSWEKHSENSEEGLPLAVVWQRVIEHQLFGVAHEAVLCGDRTGEESPGASRSPAAALSHIPSKHLRGCFQGPSQGMNINLYVGEQAETRVCTPAPSF